MLGTLLACSAVVATAQHTIVQNNGEGRIETDYNAADQVTQMRTLGAGGKLQQKVEYEYLPGYYGAQQTDTSYWPNGTPRKVSRHTYDESSNFTGEFVETFDESGNQIAGHKLMHDPWTGAYSCSEWSPAARDYKSVVCPAGEEDSGGAEETKNFTYAEVMRHLEAARKTARKAQNIGHMQPATPALPPIVTANREVGLVLPAQLRPGERVSGSLVEGHGQFEGIPEVAVTPVRVPFEATGEASRLSGWLVEVPGEKPQRADGPITFIVPQPGPGLGIGFRQAGNSAHSVSTMLNLPQHSAVVLQPHKSFRAAALCLKGDICTVSGPFGGDSRKTFAAFEDRPAAILAETSDTSYIRIPELTEPGARPLFIAEGRKVAAFPVVVGEFVIKNNQRDLAPGQQLIMSPTLDGPGDIADAQWRPDYFPSTNLARARELIPGFQPPASDAAGAKEGGEILLVLKDATPDQISLRGSKNDMLIFHLSGEAFSRGAFKYELLVEAKTAGKVDVKGYVVPFLAPILAQEFPLKAEAGR